MVARQSMDIISGRSSRKNLKYLQSTMLLVSINGNLNYIMEFTSKIIMLLRALLAGNQDRHLRSDFGMQKVAHGVQVIFNSLFTF